MKGEYDMYEQSRLSLAEGYATPDDLVLMGAMLDADMPVLMMALHMVQGEDCNPVDLTQTETADVAVLCCLLPFFKRMGLKDIHKVVDIPMFMLKRWNEAMETHLESDGISREDFEGMMGT